MKKNLKICVEPLPTDEPLCLVDVNSCELIESAGMTPDFVHKKSAHISAEWRFANQARVAFPLGNADLSAYRYLTFSVFAVNGAGGSFSIFVDSSKDGDGSSGYEYTLQIAHDGWNEYRIELPFMRAIRTPLGWNRVASVCFDCVFGGKSNRIDTVLYFDSLFVWKEMALPLYATMPELKGAAAFAKCGNYAIVNRRRVALSIDGESACPFEEKGIWWIPLGAIASVMAYSAVADNKAFTLSFTYRRKKYLFDASASVMSVDGEEQPLGFTPLVRGGMLFFPSEFVREFFRWRQVYVDPIGVIVFSNRKNIFDRKLDAHRINALIADMTFDRPTGEQILTDLHKTISNPRKGRVLLSYEELMELRRLAKTDANLKEYVVALKKQYGASSASFSAEPISRYVPRNEADLPTELHASADKMLAFATLYRVTGDKQYSERAAQEAEALAAFDNWGGDSMRMLAVVAFGMALTYDWCHHVWSEARKAIVERAILRNALRPAVEAYNGKRLTWDMNAAVAAEINCGVLSAALALADIYPETTLRIFDHVLRNAEAIMTAFMPDGGYAEGVLAWEKSARSVALLVRMLETACGTDYGFASMPGFKATAYFPIFAETQNGVWNYNNSKADFSDTSILSYFSAKTGNPVFAWWHRRELLSGKKVVTPYDVIFYTPIDDADTHELPLDAVYRNAGLAMMRADWSGEGMTLFVHGGRNNDLDGDLDAGSFILECAGERFFAETGGNEALPLLLRRRAEGQNTIVFNPTEGAIPDQNPGAVAPIVEMRSSSDRVYAILDLTATNDMLNRAKRGVMLTENRTVAVIQDEATLLEPGTVAWTAYTPASVELNASGRVARLTLNGKTLLCKLAGIGYPARFTVEEMGESGLAKLSVVAEGKDRIRMAVVCSIADDDDQADDKSYELVPMSKWAELDV